MSPEHRQLPLLEQESVQAPAVAPTDAPEYSALRNERHQQRASAAFQVVSPSPASTNDSQELWLAIHVPALEEAQHLHAAPGEAHRRRRLLERLAVRAQTYTPRVCLVPPDGLLLEIRGSLQLFSGVDNLCRLLAEEYRSEHIPSRMAVASTPLAALVRARAGHEPLVMNHARLVGSVAPLSLSALRWSSDTVTRLAKIGVYTIGQALRLPRTGFARRFGAAQLKSLDRLTGRTADPRPTFVSRERFRRIRDLPREIESCEALLHALNPLLHDMERFLRARQAGITVVECRFRHRHAVPTPCVLRLAAPAMDARRLGMLLGEKLSKMALPEPALACELRTSVIVPRSQICESLWQPGEHGGVAEVEAVQLIEHLRARLPSEAVHGLEVADDHWPENASLAVEPSVSRSSPVPYHTESVRPLWLFAEPLRLTEREGKPWYRGPVRVCSQVQKERIERGEGERDYYLAVDARSVRLWIFRERTGSHRWFLHGMFG